MAEEKRNQSGNSNSNSKPAERKAPRSTGGMAPTKTRDISGNTRGKV